MIDWYASEEGRNIVRMWVALGLPLQWKHGSRSWTTWEKESTDTTMLKKSTYTEWKGDDSTLCFGKDFQVRLTPNEDR